MNNTFDIKRFGLLLQKDLGEYCLKLKSKMGAIFIVYAGILIYTWATGLIFGTPHMNMGARLAIMMALTVLMVIMAPSMLYGHANHKLKGIAYAMLPASSLEKFLTMFLTTAILTPIGCSLALLIIDTVFSFLPLNSEIATNIFTYDLSSSHFIKVRSFVPNSPDGLWVSESISSLLATSSVFLLGNMIFKKSKISKTILSVILMWIVLATISMLTFKCLLDAGYLQLGEDLFSWVDDMSLFVKILMSLIGYFISLLILFFTYRKIKKQQY